MIEDVAGIAFPFQIDPATGGVSIATGREKIRQNIRLILSTRVGERPMLRDFGTRIANLVHDPNDEVLADLVQTQAQAALLQWEPRILLTASHVEQEEGSLTLRLRYVHTTEPIADEMSLPLT